MLVSQDGPSVSLRQLTKRYGNNTVVDHVSFDIGQHEVFSRFWGLMVQERQLPSVC